jgi:hypothetical protein
MTIYIDTIFYNVHTKREVRDERGYVVHDYFKRKGYERAESADSAWRAERILEQTYKGPDVDGIGLKWDVKEYND